jgi:tripartite-type tricarboxylate transporter receptor subunit TctC
MPSFAAREASVIAKRFPHFARALVAFMALAVNPSPDSLAAAEDYPNRPIKIVVPFAAGGALDITTRAIADKLSISLKQPVVIVNRPGAGGNLGNEAIAKSTPDGYTLGMVLGTTLTVNPSLYGKLPFDPDQDIRPIAIVATFANMLVVHPSVPVHSVAEFVAFAKAAGARKQPIVYASSGGLGSPGHVAMEYFRQHADFDAIHVPYKSNPSMVIDLVAGRVKFGFVVSSTLIDHVQAGRLRGLAVAHEGRSPLTPDVPTMAESGYPGFKTDTYFVMLAPVGIPEPIFGLLEREVQFALKQPDLIDRLRAIDITPVGIVGPEVRERLKADRETFAKVVAAANMRPD